METWGTIILAGAVALWLWYKFCPWGIPRACIERAVSNVHVSIAKIIVKDHFAVDASDKIPEDTGIETGGKHDHKEITRS